MYSFICTLVSKPDIAVKSMKCEANTGIPTKDETAETTVYNLYCLGSSNFLNNPLCTLLKAKSWAFIHTV